MSGTCSIGEAARRSGVKVPTIRYYESVGLLPAPPRSDGNRRTFGADDLKRLGFIRHARELGFDLDSIRTLLALQADPDQPCDGADAMAEARLAEVERRIASLVALKGELVAMLAACRCQHIGDCRVIEVIGDHNQCTHSHHA